LAEAAQQRTDDLMRSVLDRVAPGTPLRDGLDHIMSGHTGALIVIGDVENLLPLCDGGFDIGAPFTPQRLFELAKMDGAIILDADCSRILLANVHLVPDPSLVTRETGMRHRTAERVSRQTRSLVISISQRRDEVTIYASGHRLVLDEIEVVLSKANQALATLAGYRSHLDEVCDRLTLAEFDDVATVGPMLGVVRRFELVMRAARWVERYIRELGSDGRLVRMQADELMAGVEHAYTMLLRDYAADDRSRKAVTVRHRLADLPSEQLLDDVVLAGVLGLDTTSEALEGPVHARGYRLLAQIPMIPNSVLGRVVERFGSLQAVLAASVTELDDVDGVGARRARAVHDGLERMRRRSS
jgi:diadenylate cyclase